MPIDLDLYGLNERWRKSYEARATEQSELGRVIRQDRGFVIVVTQRGEALVATRLGRNSPVVVGDWVVVEHEAATAVLERETLLTRKDAHSDTGQAIVANVDLVLIVCGADRPLNTRRVERAVTQTVEADAIPVVVITKIDLLEDDTSIQDLRRQIPVVTIVGLSSKESEGIDVLIELMHGRTSVMIGESGAGKSTLLNKLVGNDVVKTGEVRVRDSKGRHTTVRRELHLLPGGGSIIDTPGVRSLGLWADEESVAATFPDLVAIAESCRFSDCGHASEPGCAVKAAVASGEVSVERVAAWQALSLELVELEQRNVDNARRNKGRR